MSNASTLLPAPVLVVIPPASSKWEREHAAFRRLLPHLLATHRGKFVAIHGEQMVDSSDDKLALALRVLTKVGNTDIHVGLVSEEPAPVARSGVRRDQISVRDSAAFPSRARSVLAE